MPKASRCGTPTTRRTGKIPCTTAVVDRPHGGRHYSGHVLLGLQPRDVYGGATALSGNRWSWPGVTGNHRGCCGFPGKPLQAGRRRGGPPCPPQTTLGCSWVSRHYASHRRDGACQQPGVACVAAKRRLGRAGLSWTAPRLPSGGCRRTDALRSRLRPGTGRRHARGRGRPTGRHVDGLGRDRIPFDHPRDTRPGPGRRRRDVLSRQGTQSSAGETGSCGSRDDAVVPQRLLVLPGGRWTLRPG